LPGVFQPYIGRYGLDQFGNPLPISPTALVPPDDDSDNPALDPMMQANDFSQTQNPVGPAQQPIPQLPIPTNGQSGISTPLIPLNSPGSNGSLPSNGSSNGSGGNYSGLRKLANAMPPPGGPVSAPVPAAPSPPAPVPPSPANGPADTSGSGDDAQALGAVMAPAPVTTPAAGTSVPASASSVTAPPTTVPDTGVSKTIADINKLAAERASDPEGFRPNSNWAQRLAGAVLAMTRFAPVANQIIHPKWSQQQQAQYIQPGAALQEQLKSEESAEATLSQAVQRTAQAQKNVVQGQELAALPQNRADRVKELQHKAFLGLLGPNPIPLQPGETAPSNYHILTDPTDGTVYARENPFIPVPDEMLPYLPGVQKGGQTSVTQYQKALDAKYAQDLENTKQSNKPVTGTEQKNTFMDTIKKVAAEGSITPQSLTDVNKLSQAIRGSTTLSDDEKNSALAYMAANPTPAIQGTTALIRMEGLQTSREYPVINKQSGQLEMRSAAEINSSPGNFAPAGPGATALTKNAIFQDLHYNINTARNAIQALDDMDAPTRAALSYALRHTDPASAFQTFLTGSAGAAMNPKQQEAAQALALLSENAMSLRNVAGMGQGSDDLRSAIQATLPSGKSPSKGYALSQLSKFEQVVNRLEKGVPGMTSPNGQTTNSSGVTATDANGNKVQWDDKSWVPVPK
jgi:hypothetical protein